MKGSLHAYWTKGQVFRNRLRPLLEQESEAANTAEVKANARRVATRLVQQGASPENVLAQLKFAFGDVGREEAQKVIRERGR
jgi:type VI protein secretion system component VasF